jgi:HAMP domain-containing protein
MLVVAGAVLLVLVIVVVGRDIRKLERRVEALEKKMLRGA